MGDGIELMERLKHEAHVGYCNHCRAWTAFKKLVQGAYVCPTCGYFGIPGYNARKEIEVAMYAFNS